MIVVKIKGGLGNQMFQYAAGRSLAKRLGTKLLLDIRTYTHSYNRQFGLNNFQIDASIATQDELTRWPDWTRKTSEWLQRVGIHTRRFRELQSSFDPGWSNLDDETYLEGYFASERYFSSIKDTLVSEFQLSTPLSEENQQIANIAHESESVMVHVRRGDYVENRKVSEKYGPCTSKYYERAIELLSNNVRDPQFMVFSDDLDWARKNIYFPGQPIFVEGNNERPEVDIYLMTQGKNHIIANSTFSWWGAWLKTNKNGIVICPSPWFENKKYQDIYSQNWIKVQKI